jgi:hypothetical protein
MPRQASIATVAFAPVGTPCPALKKYLIPSLCGYPDATNTGYSGKNAAGGPLTQGQLTHYTGGDFTTSSDGQVIADTWFDGAIIIVANINVTIRRCLITANSFWLIRQQPGATTGLVIQDCEIYPKLGPPSTADYGISLEQSAATVKRCNIHNTTSGIHCTGTGLVIQDCFIHDVVNISGVDHCDCILDPGGNTGNSYLHNTLFNNIGQTSCMALFNDAGATNGVTIDSNLMDASGFAIYPGAPSSTNLKITNNIFGGLYGSNKNAISHDSFPAGAGNVWSGNIWDDDGTTIPPP